MDLIWTISLRMSLFLRIRLINRFNGSIGGYNGDAGDTLNFTPGCANPQITWYKVDPVTGEKIIIKGPGIGTTLDVVEKLEANADAMIMFEGLLS